VEPAPVVKAKPDKVTEVCSELRDIRKTLLMPKPPSLFRIAGEIAACIASLEGKEFQP
jgi:hypothetical protein